MQLPFNVDVGDFMPSLFLCFQMGYLRKETDGSLLYTVVNQLDPDAEGLVLLLIILNGCCKGSRSTKLKQCILLKTLQTKHSPELCL